MNYTTAVKPPSTSTDSSPPTSDSSRATSNVQHDEDRFTLENEIDNAISHVNSSMVTSQQQPPPTSAPPLPPPSGSPPSLPPALVPSSTSSSTTNPEDWNIDQVAEWLKSVGLGNVSSIFIGKFI